jgi:hypothetical protein
MEIREATEADAVWKSAIRRGDLRARAGVEAGFALFFHNYSTFLGQPGIYLEDLFVAGEVLESLTRRSSQLWGGV